MLSALKHNRLPLVRGQVQLSCWSSQLSSADATRPAQAREHCSFRYKHMHNLMQLHADVLLDFMCTIARGLMSGNNIPGMY